MDERQADDRSLNFAGDVSDDGQPLPMTIEVLRARTEKWPISERAPEGVAALLSRSRQMFVDGYFTYENFMDAATRSMQAVEAALRVRFDANEKFTFFQLIDRARTEGLVNDYTHEILHAGRQLRNRHIHATDQQVWPPALTANVIGASHLLVAELFDENCELESPEGR